MRRVVNLRLNVVANLIGRGWTSLMSFAFVPLYIRFMGAEGYGLIGVFTAILAIFVLLDLGLGLTVNRELSRLSTVTNGAVEARTLLRTLEAIYWLVGALIGGVVALGAPVIADRWLNAGHLPPHELTHALRLMGLTLLFRWPVALYMGALLGLGRQVAANTITAVAATFAGGGAVLVLAFVSPNPHAFFAWQAMAAFIQVTVIRTVAWRSISLVGHRPRIDVTVMRSSIGFSAGITGITLLSIVLTQLDKLVLTRLLSLEQFGFYALAGSIAGLLSTAGATVETAVFPALTRHVAEHDAAGERTLYHRASQGLALLVVPAATTIALFPRELLTLYIGTPSVVAGVAPLLRLMAIGNGLLALMLMPLSLQLANGWTRLSLYKNVVAVILYVPLLFVLVGHFGATGAALAWVALTAGYALFEVPLMHRRLLPGAQWRWYGIDVGIPVILTLAVLVPVRLFLPSSLHPIVSVAAIAIAAMLALFSAMMGLPDVRHKITRRLAEPFFASRAFK